MPILLREAPRTVRRGGAPTEPFPLNYNLMTPPRRRTIALYRPLEADLSSLVHGLQRHNYTVVTAAHPSELTTHTEANSGSFEAIIAPLRIDGGMSGITACLQTRADEILAAVPLIGLSNSREPAVLTSFYGAGADVVVVSPFDVEHLNLQIEALARQKRLFDEQVRALGQSSGLKRSIYEAFNVVREGVLVFTLDGAIAFINAPGRSLLGAAPDIPVTALGGLAGQFAPFLPAPSSSGAGGSPSNESRALITRLDGRKLKVGLRISTIYGADEAPAGFAVGLTDLNELGHLSSLLEQDQRTRSLALIGAAGCMTLLGDRGAPLHSIIPQVESSLAGAPPRCEFGPTVTALLEVLDTVLNPGAKLKVDLGGDAVVALSAGDFFQLVGHVILHAVARSGIGGETTVHAAVTPRTVELHIVSSPAPFGCSHSNDILGRLIRGTWSERAAEKLVDRAPQPDFDAARTIAHRCGVTLKERALDKTDIEYVVAVPRV